MSLGSDFSIQAIVDGLNQPPLSKGLTLVTFDERTPFELLQLLNDVFALLDQNHAKDLRDEQPEAMLNRMVDFLWILNYKHTLQSQEFRQRLSQGDRQLIYPVLFWMLQRVPELQKRAFLARFLVNIEVPEEMFADEVVVEVFQQYKELQAQFKETHKIADKLRSNRFEPGEIKREIQQLEEEKEQLNTKITKIKQRVQNVESFDQLFEVTSALRREQEEEAKLAESLDEQQHLLQQSEQKYKRTLDSFKEQKSGIQDESSLQLLDKLEAEVRVNRERVEEGMMRDIEDKRTRIKQVQEIRQMPSVSENDILQVQAAIRQLNNEITALTEKQAKNNPQDDKLTMFRQQAALVAKKKQEKQEKLKLLEEDRNHLRSELSDKEEACEGIKGSKILKGEEFKKYASSLRGKSNTYKRMKAELADIRAEWGVLNRTEQILKSKEGNLGDFLAKLEKGKAAGYSETKENLEKVSAMKSELDEEKGKTLEEISRVVTEINNSIKERKSKLAPQIKELRSIRQKYQELENEYMEKKAVYDNTNVGLESERSKAEGELSAYREEAARDESRYSFAQVFMCKG